MRLVGFGSRGMVMMVRGQWLLRIDGMAHVSRASSFAHVRHHRSASYDERDCESEEATHHLHSEYIARRSRRVFA